MNLMECHRCGSQRMKLIDNHRAHFVEPITEYYSTMCVAIKCMDLLPHDRLIDLFIHLNDISEICINEEITRSE